MEQPAQQEPVAYLHQCGKKPELKELSFKKNEPLLAAKGYKAIPLTSPPAQQEPLTGGDERRHIICLCPDCIKTPQRKPLTHEQRVDLLAKFEAHKHEWHAPAILIDMVEAAHGIGEKK